MTALTLNRREGKPYRKETILLILCAYLHTDTTFRLSVQPRKTTFARHDALDYLHVIFFSLSLSFLFFLPLGHSTSYILRSVAHTHTTRTRELMTLLRWPLQGLPLQGRETRLFVSQKSLILFSSSRFYYSARPYGGTHGHVTVFPLQN